MSTSTSQYETILRCLSENDCINLMDVGTALRAIGNILNDPELENVLERSDVIGLNCATRVLGSYLSVEAESMQDRLQVVLDAVEVQEVRHEN